MPFPIRCPGCDVTLNVGENLVGKTIKCNKCGEMIAVKAPAAAKAAPARPAARAAVVEDDEDVVPAKAKRSRVDDEDDVAPVKSPRRRDDDDDDYDDRPRKKSAKPAAAEGKSKLPLLAGVLVAVVLLGGGAVGAYFAFFADKKSDSAQNTGTGTPPPPPPASPIGGPSGEPDKKAEVDTKPAPEPEKPPTPIKTAPAAQSPPVTPVGTVPVVPPSNSTEYQNKLMSGVMDEITLTKAKRAAVFLHVHESTGESTGSGWFGIEPGLIITNAHVIGMIAPGSKPPLKITAYVNSGEHGQNPGVLQRTIEHNRIKIIAVDRVADLAILQVIGEKDLPEPLKIRPSVGLKERQGITVIGFPKGYSPSKATGSAKQPTVSVRTSSVSSFRYNDHGLLRRVQVEGGISPGNSGGPIVDADGFVIAVTVEVHSQERQLGFGVPTESVVSLIAGGIMEMEYEQPYLVGEKVHVPVKAICADPLGRLKTVGVAAWIGDNSTTIRPPGATRTGTLPSDKEFQRVELKYDAEKKIATGEIVYNRLPPGQTYWTQPFYANKIVSPYWMAGLTLPSSGPPVERVAASLRVNLRAGTTRPITLTREINSEDYIEGEGEAKKDRILEKTTIKGTERIYDPDRSDSLNAARIRLTYDDIDIKGVTGEGIDAARVPPDLMLLIKRGINQVEAYGYLNRQGELYKYRTNAAPNSNPIAQLLIPEISNEVLTSLQVCSIPIPNRDVQPLETWRTTKNIVLTAAPDPASLPGAGQPTPPGGRGRGQMPRPKEYKYTAEMTFTYLGSRTRGGKREAVVKMEGKSTPAAGQPADSVRGESKGFAFVDIATGVVIESEVESEFEIDTSEQGFKKKKSEIGKYRIVRGGPTN